ncbi:Arc family DNA-binding protein [Grimontia sp. NTOU-MAR1]|uniref:Arc family DNA-binding protein n=1 Tax=Grimontia sp. NTOU-MAR1 TaxID=3111011 RepID=UPI002DBC17A3|nr:Arc family DNA-binding protein [Grimontia sp. NTOU-MAR1]WRV98875.1 Arc family DNA-binding protein [Grimontia sp. NTOU-MAR1]
MSDIQKTALRLPRDLHTQVVKAAKENDRTMNSEIVNRLETSFKASSAEAIKDASQARIIAQQSRQNVKEAIRQLCYAEITRIAQLGGHHAYIGLHQFELDSYTQEGWQEVITPIIREFRDKGFDVGDDDVNVSSLSIRF